MPLTRRLEWEQLFTNENYSFTDHFLSYLLCPCVINCSNIFKDLITLIYLSCTTNTSLICGTGASVFPLYFKIFSIFWLNSHISRSAGLVSLFLYSFLNQPATHLFINPITERAILNETVINAFTHPPFRSSPNLPADYINLNLQSTRENWKPPFSGEFRIQKALLKHV